MQISEFQIVNCGALSIPRSNITSNGNIKVVPRIMGGKRAKENDFRGMVSF